MKRKDKKKEKSAKQWADRIETVAGKMHEKQDIRKHNLDQRRKGGAIGANLSSKRMVEDENEKEENGGKKKKQKREGPYSKIGRDDKEATGTIGKDGKEKGVGGGGGEGEGEVKMEGRGLGGGKRVTL